METIKNIEYYMSLHYPVTIVKEDDGSYFIEYPDLEGCFACGETIEDALQMGEDARREWTECALESASFIPEPTSAADCPDNYKVHMPKSLYRTLSKRSKEEHCSMNQLCVYLLAKGCSENVNMI